MGNMMTLFLIAYGTFGVVAWFVLVKWLHKNKHEELGKSLSIEIIYGFMLAFTWPASIMLMLLNDCYSNSDDDNDDEL